MDGTGNSGVLCGVSDGRLLDIEYLYQKQFTFKQMNTIQDIMDSTLSESTCFKLKKTKNPHILLWALCVIKTIHLFYPIDIVSTMEHVNFLIKPQLLILFLALLY